MIEICTVWAPRPNDPHWRDDYPLLLKAQRDSALRVGHTHRVVTDTPLDGFDYILADLGAELMPAMIRGVIHRLEHPADCDLVLVDIDVLVNAPVGPIFRKRGKFDVGLTIRANEAAPVNNGAMYVPHGHAMNALGFFRRALELCGTHWGADQEAISQAAAPVPVEQCYAQRAGIDIAFLSSKFYAPVPKVPRTRHTGSPIVHFKGGTKDWMLDYAREFLAWEG